MRITRAKSFEDKDGNWQKFEIELTSDDLTPSELETSESLHATLLEIKAEQCLNAFLVRMGEISPDDAKANSAMLQGLKESLVSSPSLKRRASVN